MLGRLLMADNNKLNRVTVYDWVRLLATIFIVLAHSVYLGSETTYGGVVYDAPENISPMFFSVGLEWIGYISSWVSLFVIQLFFMLSGAMLAIKPLAPMDRLIKGKSKRLLLPYFVYGWLFMLPIKWLSGFYDSQSIIDAMRGFLSGEDSGHLWFLPALFWGAIFVVSTIKILERLNINSIYLLLGITGVIYYIYDYLPFDFLGLKQGLSYAICIAAGYVFEKERQKIGRLNIHKTILLLILLVTLEVLDVEFHVLNMFFIITVGTFLSYIVSDLLDRAFVNVSNNMIWKFIIRNLFYVYLFHDPMNYLILKLTFENGWLTSSFGCIAYIFLRTVGVFVVSLFLGELVGIIKKSFGKLLEDR